jgi:hypothetical protein
MNLQKKTIQRYKQFFPNETLRETSARTGIQITRVFRLLNGKAMKVGELEAFERAIAYRIAEKPAYAALSSSIETASTLLTDEELRKLAEYVQRKLALKNYSKSYFNIAVEAAEIA